MSDRYEVCSVRELPPGHSKIIEVKDGRHSIGVFNVNGEFYALANICPHQLAPLCEGTITGEITGDRAGDFELTRDGEVIRCPWHGWKFNIKDGTSVFNPHKLKTRSYKTEVEKVPQCVKSNIEEYGTRLEGDEPPVDSYEVEIEDELIVVYA
ncbi:Rieske (2Fe-2S) protein [Natrononativus amylolyticus]|uniref:Rieske (2Fe-2S) protein n=1 Tax=Natrononativus amylolyticus TaxID=2963434 RepID=UPI0020CBAF5C|nr:Rieske (2Fe-2S) protein [Natrononativus amylolyticus]